MVYDALRAYLGVLDQSGKDIGMGNGPLFQLHCNRSCALFTVSFKVEHTNADISMDCT